MFRGTTEGDGELFSLLKYAHVSFSSYVANGGDIVAFVTIAHFDFPMFLIRKHEEIYFSNRPPFLWVYGRNKPFWDVGKTQE